MADPTSPPRRPDDPAGCALVISVSSRSCRVHVPGRGDLRGTLRGTLWERAEERGETRPVAVGDRVRVAIEGDEAVIEEVLPRHSRLARQEAGGGKRGKVSRLVQVIAANIDRLLVIAALDDPPFRPGLVDRFLVAAAASDLHAVLVLNKVDLAEARPGLDRAVVRPYREAGLQVIETSAVSGEGIEELRDLMRDGISLLVGHSGVGKSSLLNAVAPGLGQAIGRVTDYHGRGRHTTTIVSLLPLPAGGWVVDSPGIREFGVEGVAPADLARLYPGFGAHPDACRFSDCLHRDEPGCAVRAAVARGEIAPERHESYLRLLDDSVRQSRPYTT